MWRSPALVAFAGVLVAGGVARAQQAPAGQPQRGADTGAGSALVGEQRDVPGDDHVETRATAAGPPPTGSGPATAAGAADAGQTPATGDPPAPPRDTEGPEALYHLAFAALADGDVELARSLLQRILVSHPGHPLVQHARGLLAVMDAPSQPRGRDLETAPSQPTARGRKRQGATGIARAELVFSQTVHGIALGAEACGMLECDEAQPWAAMLMLGAGAGFGVSFFASSDGVTPGLSRAATDGVIWGAANGLFVLLGSNALDDTQDEGTVVSAHLALGQLLGLGAAGGLYHYLEPTAGQVSLTSSGGMWTLAATAQLMGAIEPDLEEDGWAWVLMGASDLGLVAGGLLASHEPMGTSRVLMIDAGGLLGGLTGLGVAFIAQQEAEVGPTFSSGFVGTLLGLGLAYHLTRDWDRDEGTSARLVLAPTAGGLRVRVTGTL